MIIDSYCREDTFELGKQLGRVARAGDVVCLTGALGVGKTVFTQGFARGMGIEDIVSSPTFTIVQEYSGAGLPLYHFDVYRIADIGEMEEIGYEDYFYGNGVCLIEWAEIIDELLPPDRTAILIEKDIDKGFDYRRITVTVHKKS
jgi:tRNA threonylcarbamoyladenosine biosynthesis protein TsaE